MTQWRTDAKMLRNAAKAFDTEAEIIAYSHNISQRADTLIFDKDEAGRRAQRIHGRYTNLAVSLRDLARRVRASLPSDQDAKAKP